MGHSWARFAAWLAADPAGLKLTFFSPYASYYFVIHLIAVFGQVSTDDAPGAVSSYQAWKK
jgi:hypothetical protein